MSRDINDPEIRVNIRRTSSEEKEEPSEDLLSRILIAASIFTQYDDVTGYASLNHIGDSFADGFYSDIPHLLRAMTVIEPDELNQNIKLDITSHKCSNSEVSKECAVCLEKVKLGDKLATIDCAHTFHYSCIIEWGKYKQQCPLCRSRIPILERRRVN
jgi:hypothetical protein